MTATTATTHTTERRPPVTRNAAERYALATAGGVIVLLTATAFWLSYAHLAEVAGQHGLGGSPARRWAWPATLDAFIVAGELLMLRAGLRRTTDWCAIALTVTGSVGSIALNVAGVSSANNTGSAPFLDYVVAAVPPAAALLAFGALMRQVHQHLDHASTDHDPTDEEPPAGAPPAGSPDPWTELAPQVADSAVRGGRPPSATIEELAAVGRATAAEHGKLTRGLLRQAVRDNELTMSSERATEVMNLLKPELEAASEAPVPGV